MSLQYIRDYYKVPAVLGNRVRYTGDPAAPVNGTITGAQDSRLRVLFDGEKRPSILHPTWEVKYLEPTP
jgi:hypothetical protein